jgi:hypothetical protein
MTTGLIRISAVSSASVSTDIECRNSTHSSSSEDLLLRWLQKAITWLKAQRNAVSELERGILVGKLMQWKKMVAEWEVDHSAPDPYEEREEGKL